MSTPVKTTGTAKAWTTSKWRGIDEINRMIAKGDNDGAINGMTYRNHDMKSLTNEQILDQMPAQLFPTYVKEFIQFGRAIEALCNSRERKPLTDEQAMDAYCETPPFGTYKEAFIAGIRFIEASNSKERNLLTNEQKPRIDCGECPNITSGCESGHCIKGDK